MIERAIVIVLVILCVGILVLSDFNKGRVYDCRDAHWHPDVPAEVKRECSKLMYENWKRKEDERKNEKGIHENRPDLFRT
jgi:hypothetical protein